MDRRGWLLRASALAAATGIGVVGGMGVEEIRFQTSDSGAGVAAARPAHLSAMLTVWRAPIEQPIAALTFDDGPDPRYTPGVLAALDHANVAATFFMVGRNVTAHPELARRVAERHEIGNHTDTHPKMSRASSAQAHRELSRAHKAIERVTKKTPTVFRPPYGVFSAATELVAASMGYDMILWSDGINPRATPANNVSRLNKSVGAGSVVIGHDGGKLPNRGIILTLPSLIVALKEKQLRLVTITELLSVMRSSAGPPHA